MSIPFKTINRVLPPIVAPPLLDAVTAERTPEEQARRDALKAAKKAHKEAAIVAANAAKKERRRAHAAAHAAGIARRAVATKSLDAALADETRESIDGALAFIQRLHDKSGQSYRDVLHALLKFEVRS